MRLLATLTLVGTLIAPPVHADEPGPRHELTRVDADAWLDGFVPVALARGDIAGAVVVIVKDGQVLTERGFGYADRAARIKVDPTDTLFRVGSTSKLFTWTAVMQLVEQGKIDLDADVNRYLDFTIPSYRGQPITMRNIMTHTSGFEDVVKGGITFSGTVDPLGVVVKRMLPSRVFAPGTTPAYSNYATAVAGYIVERVAGMPFDDYIERHIFEPLGMTHSTFRQPVPERFARFMAKGYPQASVDPEPFELVSVPPAGSLSMSGADAARFMIAQLNHGAGLMKPATAGLMQTPARGALAQLNRMALGFYEQRINGVEAIAHGGDLNFFHGYLWLFPAANVGLVIEMNSAGEHQAAEVTRQLLFEEFSDRYFPPASATLPVELGTAKDHARMLAGSYISSRAAFTTFLDVENFLSQTAIGLDGDGRPAVPDLFDGPPRKWIEVAPFLWRDAFGHGLLGAEVRDGRVVRWSVNDVSPFMVYDRAPWYRDAAWLMPAFLAGLAAVALAALTWPIGAAYRRRYRAKPALAGEAYASQRLTLAFAWLVGAVLGGWALLFMLLGKALGTFEWLIWLLELLGTVAFVGFFGLALRELARSIIGGRGWLATLGHALLTCSALAILWVALAFHLISFGAQY